MLTEKNDKDVQLIFRVEPHIAEKLEAEASKRGLNRTSLAKMIVYEHYNKEGIQV
jgi:hypothetical protein